MTDKNRDADADTTSSDEKIFEQLRAGTHIVGHTNSSFEGEQIYFGLETAAGEILYFRIDSKKCARLATEIKILSRKSAWIADGQPMEKFITEMMSNAPLATGGTSFYASLYKYRHGQKHLEDLYDALQYHMATLVPTVEHLKDEGEESLWAVKYNNNFSASIPLIIGDVVHNLRTALDILINDISEIKTGKRGSHWPFANSLEEFNELIIRKYKNLDDKAIAIIKALAPYNGGNMLLHNLHKLDILDKHRQLIPSAFIVLHQFKRNDFINGLLRKEDGSTEEIKVEWVGFSDTVALKNGEIIRTPRGKNPQHYFEFKPTNIEAHFPSDHTIYPNENIFIILYNMLNMVGQIIREFRLAYK